MLEMLEMFDCLVLVESCCYFLSIVETFHAVAMQCIATISSTMTNAVIVSPSFRGRVRSLLIEQM